jgi:PRTRC genetic system ThiF family protein
MENITNSLVKQISLNYEAKRKLNVHRPLKSRSALNISLDRISEVKEFRSKWDVEKDPIEIIIVGAGGTGGYLVRDLSRFLYSLDKRLQVPTMDIQVTLIDGDVVEEKNILRQNFLPQDIGFNKAEVLAKRHSKAFGLNISYIPEMFGSYTCSVVKKNRIVIGCVDNNEARREIAYFISRCWDGYNPLEKNAYWIDSGNEKKTGQVIVGSKELQDVTDLYPEIYIPEYDSTEQISCAERMLQDEQNMFVNLTASNLILNYVKNIILDIPMVTHGTVFNIDNKFDNYYILKKTNNE